MKARRSQRAFTILEVMIALAIFFACTFGILALVSQSLRQARALRPMNMDARSAIALLSLTNQLAEGPIPPEIVEAFQRENPDFRLMGEIRQVETNGLFQADLVVSSVSSSYERSAITMNSSVLLFEPRSQQTRLGPTITRPRMR
jgi:type II secretory pathway pseudopilin PulG